jgi:hypothetical protein
MQCQLLVTVFDTWDLGMHCCVVLPALVAGAAWFAGVSQAASVLTGLHSTACVLVSPFFLSSFRLCSPAGRLCYCCAC